MALHRLPHRLARLALAHGRPSRHLVALAGVERFSPQAQLRDAAADLRPRRDRVAHAADAHHVAALLPVRVAVEQIIGDVLQHGFDLGAGELARRHLRIGDRRLRHHILSRDGIAGKQRRAPAKPRRQRDLGFFLLEQRAQDELVHRAVEIAAAIEQTFAHRQFLRELGCMRRPDLRDVRRHVGVRGQQIGEHRQQAIAIVAHATRVHLEVEHADEFAVRAGIGDERLAVQHRRRHAVVRVPAEDRVDAAHASGELEVDIHAVVREQHHGPRALGARLVDQFLQARFLDAEGPIREAVARVGDRRVRKGLADDRHSFMHCVRREHGVFEVHGAHVLREELDRRELFHCLQHALGPVGKFPVGGHVLHAQAPLRADHVRALGPERGGRAVPAVAAVEDERVRPRGAQPLHQRRDMRVAAHPAVAARGGFEIEVRERVRLRAGGRDAVMGEEPLADEMRRVALIFLYADVYARLAEVDRKELRMHIGDMQQGHVAEGRELIELIGRLRVARSRPQRGARGGGESQEPEEGAPLQTTG